VEKYKLKTKDNNAINDDDECRKKAALVRCK